MFFESRYQMMMMMMITRIEKTLSRSLHQEDTTVDDGSCDLLLLLLQSIQKNKQETIEERNVESTCNRETTCNSGIGPSSNTKRRRPRNVADPSVFRLSRSSSSSPLGTGTIFQVRLGMPSNGRRLPYICTVARVRNRFNGLPCFPSPPFQILFTVKREGRRRQRSRSHLTRSDTHHTSG